MKQWKCTVCGYIHTGENPPERCPVCGAPKEKFVLLAGKRAEEEEAVRFPASADVLVVGSGAAAFAAAISARSRGASVIMLEKAEAIGGTTIRSGGGYWIPDNQYQYEAGIEDNREDCLRYMARYSYPHLYNADMARFGLPEHAFSLLEAYVDNAGEMERFLADSGALNSIIGRSWTGEAMVDYMDHLPENKGIRGRTLFPRMPDGSLGYGEELIRQLNSWAMENNILVYTNAEVTRILQDGNKEVTGLEVLNRGIRHTLRANQAVIFGSGGYSHNPAMMLSFQRGPHFGGCSVPTNTGDFIRLAGGVGAQIGNTAGAFRTQSILQLALDTPGGTSSAFYIPGDSVLEVNRYGCRFVDEKRNYTDRTMTHFHWNAQHAEWDHMLTFLLFDKRTASLWQGAPPYPADGENPSYLLSGSTWEELEYILAAELEGLRRHTGSFSLAPSFGDNLAKSILRFNAFAKTGKDLDFERGEFTYDKEWTSFPPTVPNGSWPEVEPPNYTMHPLAEQGPYYAIILAAGTLDTNGGPVIDSSARVLDWNGEVIPGLYGAGNCIASPTANAYWGAGSTIGPAMAFGYIAGQAQGKN